MANNPTHRYRPATRGQLRRRRSPRNGTLLLVVATLSCAAGCGTTSPAATDGRTSSTIATASDLVGAGVGLESKGNDNGARQLFEQALGLDPKDTAAYYDLGVLDQDIGNISGALVEYTAALATNPRFVPALYNEAIAYETTSPSLAVSTLKEVIVLQPDAPTAFLNLGLLENKEGHATQARQDLLKAIQLEPGLTADIPAKLLPTLNPTSTTTSNTGTTTTSNTGSTATSG